MENVNVLLWRDRLGHLHSKHLYATLEPTHHAISLLLLLHLQLLRKLIMVKLSLGGDEEMIISDFDKFIYCLPHFRDLLQGLLSCVDEPIQLE